jgi:hypothetical protein
MCLSFELPVFSLHVWFYFSSLHLLDEISVCLLIMIMVVVVVVVVTLSV